MTTVNGIEIVGADLVPQKMIDYIDLLTGDKGFCKNDVKAVIFEEEDTANILGSYYKEGRVVVVYLQHCILQKLGRIKKNDPEIFESQMSLRASLWLSLINTITHEFIHNESHKACREAEEELVELEEDEVEKEARLVVIDIAKEYDIEPPPLVEYKFLETIGVAEDLFKLLSESQDDWAKKQRSMAELKLVVDYPEGNILLTTLREYLFIAAETEETWEETVKPLVERNVEPEETTEPVSKVYEEPQQQTAVWQTSTEPMYNDEPEMEPEPDIETCSVYGHTQTAPANVGVVQNINPGEVMRQILDRMYNRMFNDCGYTPGSEVLFNRLQNIYEPIFIGDIEGANQVLTSCAIQGQTWRPEVDIWNRVDMPSMNGHIVGMVCGKKENIPYPAFKFYVNKNGRKSARWLIAQNPNKIDGNGMLKPYAIEIRNGARIAWLMYADDETDANGNRYIQKVINGTWSPANFNKMVR